MRGPRMGGRMGALMDPRSRFFLALANDQRLRILDILRQQEQSSAALVQHIGLDPSAISRHVMMLRQMGLVSARKEGVAMYFQVADPRIYQVLDLASQIIQDWLDAHRQFFSG